MATSPATARFNIDSGPAKRPCKACQHPRDGDGRMTVSSTTITALRQSSNAGCITCRIFSSAIQEVVQGQKEEAKVGENPRVTFEFQMSYQGDSLAINVLGPRLRISFLAMERTPWLRKTLPDLPAGRSVPDSTGSDASVEWVRQQLLRCSRSHEPCRSVQQRACSKMPRRVLDVGSAESSSIRLLESKDQAGAYACLSYCWGKRAFITTTSKNVQDHRQDIPWASLPLTFQHAIQLSRKLGIRYLWIDSLCIIQDDPDDWKRESAQMASIYQGAHLVIVAAKAPDPYDGLFSFLDDSFQPSPLPVLTLEDHEEKVWYRPSLTHMPGPLDLTGAASSTMPTLKRGWIFQERLLATRVVHFGPQELMWECLEESTCQCIIGDVPSSPQAARPPLSSISLARSGMPQLKNASNPHTWTSCDSRELGRCWHGLVEQYSSLQLSHETDVFPAFSGVARSFQAAYRSEYLAGLWEASLLSDLLWHVDGPHGDTSSWGGRPSTWRAPSWSWASVISPVKFIDTSSALEPCCTVAEVSCKPSGPDPTGEVSSGLLQLVGKLIPTNLVSSSAHEPGARTPWNLYKLEVMQDKICNTWADENTIFGRENEHGPDNSQAYCLPIGVRSASQALECLVLRRLPPESSMPGGVYTRIGLLEIPRPRSVGFGGWIDSSAQHQTVFIS